MTDNRFSTRLLVENYGMSKIIITDEINNNGILETDERGNILNGDLVENIQIIKTSPSIGMQSGEGVLLYNDTEWLHWDNSTTFNFNDGSFGKTISLSKEPIKYKINARQESYTFDGNSIVMDNTPYPDSFFTDTLYTIFKVYLNGKETTEYTISTNTTITFTDSYEYNTFNNTIDIVYYRTSQTITASIESEMYVYLPNKVDTGGIFTLDIDGFNISSTSAMVPYGGSDLLDLIDNTNGVPNNKTFVVYEDSVSIVKKLYSSSMKLEYSLGVNITPVTLRFTTFNILGTIGDYSISESKENKSYYGRNNKIGTHKLLNSKNTITFTSWNQKDVIPVMDKLPVLSDNFEEFMTNNKLMRVVEYKENTEEIIYYNRCKVISGISKNRNMSNEDNITLNYESKIVI